ncbi:MULTISPECIES: creatininase family protein [Streptomyces]|uniref:creatininase family protein n=1 Tax=Streptomyces TaxID=1883 RepID=UPI001678FD48|nr:MULTISPECIES: creatininase family protein [Streptomyces]MBD3577219.1 creatininase family protein [Streptomyces sp. KD18]GGS86484.1 creatinine amidohydrolase [Streptomyces toxytricini]
MTLLPNITTVDVQEQAPGVAVLPVGSYEQHGPYLPLITDTAIACIIAREIAAAYPVLVLPPISIACSHEHGTWPGTVSISARTLHAVITDIAASLEASGIHKLVLVNAHGGNYVLSNIVQEANLTEPRMSLFPQSREWSRAREHAGLSSSAHDDMHAGEIETSILLHAEPSLVRPGYEAADHEAADRPFLLTLGMQEYTKSGVIGFPSHSTAEKGRMVLQSLSNDFQAHLATLAGKVNNER